MPDLTPEPQIAHLKDVDISYFDIGEGNPILLIHGFGSTAAVNWINTGWVKTLNEGGYRCIALDNRGHGSSSKFYSPDDYGPDIFAEDAFGLLDHLGIEKCPIIGFSMGARISAWMCHSKPERITQAVFGGMGINMMQSASDTVEIAKALEVDDPETITSPDGKRFRAFADRTGSDRLALAACIRPSRTKITKETMTSITTRVLVAVGDEDDVGGPADELAAIMQNAEAFVMPGLDHMRSTGARVFKDRTLEFLR